MKRVATALVGWLLLAAPGSQAECRQVLKSEFVDGFEVSDNQLYNSLVQRVLKSGVKFAAGSDMGWHYPGKTRGQTSVGRFPTLHEAGMPRLT
jgi:hypothetical protein